MKKIEANKKYIVITTLIISKAYKTHWDDKIYNNFNVIMGIFSLYKTLIIWKVYMLRKWNRNAITELNWIYNLF